MRSRREKSAAKCITQVAQLMRNDLQVEARLEKGTTFDSEGANGEAGSGWGIAIVRIVGQLRSNVVDNDVVRGKQTCVAGHHKMESCGAGESSVAF